MRRASVDLFGEIGPEYKDDGTVPGPSEEDTRVARQAAASVTYPLLDGLRAINEVYRDANLLDAEIIRLSDAAETITLNAVQAYIDVFRRRNIVQISEENISVHVQIAEEVAVLVDAGRLFEPDRFQANDKLLAARLAHADAKASLADAVSTYRLVVGSAPWGGLTITVLSNISRSADALEASAVQNSFLVQIAQKDINAFDYQEAIEAADWQPQLDLFLRGGVETDVDGADGTGAFADLEINDISTSDGYTVSLDLQGDLSGTQIALRSLDGFDELLGNDLRNRFTLGADDGIADGRGGDRNLIRYDRDDVGNSATGEGVTVTLAPSTVTVQTPTGPRDVENAGQATGLWSGRSFTHALLNINEVRGSNLNYTITDGPGDDRLFGGAGDDTIVTGEGRDRVFADEGNDFIDASAGTPETQDLFAGDFINPGLGQDTVIGNSALWAAGEGIDIGYENIEGVGGLIFDIDNGTDTSADPGSGTVRSAGLEINDTFTYANFFTGSNDSDVFNGSDLDRFEGFVGAGGADVFNGGAGFDDTVVYEFEHELFGNQGSGIEVNGLAGTIIDTQGGLYTFSGIERIRR